MPQGIAHMAYGANTNVGPGPAYQHAVPNLMLELKLNVLVPSTDRHFLIIVPGGVCVKDLFPIVDKQHEKLFGESINMTYFKNLSNAVIGEDYMIQNAFSDGDTIEAHTDSLGAGQAKRTFALAGLAAASGGSGKKRRKDPNKPKRPTNAFMHYVDERRPILLDTHCGGPELMKLLGQEWATMTEAEKLPYKQRSAARLNEYREEKVRYNQTFPTAANPPREQTKKLLRRLMQQIKMPLGDRDEGKMRDLLDMYNETRNQAKTRKWLVKQLEQIELKDLGRLEAVEVAPPFDHAAPLMPDGLDPTDYHQDYQGLTPPIDI
eukprot:m.443560 g.443560  ORF g.443560 m.443560 type:complete len:320 (+) comp18979_c0_seq1:130-1089(+)